MPKGNPKVSDEEFVAAVKKLGPTAATRIIGSTERNVYARRRRLEEKLGEPIEAPRSQKLTYGRVEIPDFTDGRVLVASDAHYMPGKITPGHKAFVAFVKEYKPAIVVMNGDVLDAPTISRHPPMPGWEKSPSVAEEIGEAQVRLAEIAKAAGRNARLVWPLGNHDARFSVRLATAAPEYANVHGTRLRDHFDERWEPCWSVFIGGEKGVVVKHRFKGGIHSTHNNVLWSGRSMVCGHQHSLKVTPFDNYAGRFYGVDTGCLAEPYGEQFSYSEDNPRNHRQGFVLLTFKGGRLLWPEVISVCGPDEVEFRGDVVRV
jgi:hypothetical protein